MTSNALQLVSGQYVRFHSATGSLPAPSNNAKVTAISLGHASRLDKSWTATWTFSREQKVCEERLILPRDISSLRQANSFRQEDFPIMQTIHSLARKREDIPACMTRTNKAFPLRDKQRFPFVKQTLSAHQTLTV
jgi:hypothetical protein